MLLTVKEFVANFVKKLTIMSCLDNKLPEESLESIVPLSPINEGLTDQLLIEFWHLLIRK